MSYYKEEKQEVKERAYGVTTGNLTYDKSKGRHPSYYLPDGRRREDLGKDTNTTKVRRSPEGGRLPTRVIVIY